MMTLERTLIFGREDSGKSTIAYQLLAEHLSHTDGIALILARKSKSQRKAPAVDPSIASRMLYKWIDDRVSVVKYLSNFHLFSDQPLVAVLFEDIQEYGSNASQTYALLSLLNNSISLFENCILVVTLTPRVDHKIPSFRIFMTNFINTLSGRNVSGRFYKSLRKTNLEIEHVLGIN